MPQSMLLSKLPSKEERGVSTGADTKVNALELVRVLSSLLQRLQCGVALESLGESGSSFGAKVVVREAASMEAEAGAEAWQRALTRKQTLESRFERGAQSGC